MTQNELLAYFFENYLPKEEITYRLPLATSISSGVTKKTCNISRFATKDLPEPGEPRKMPLGFRSSFRSAIMRLLLVTFCP